MSAPDTPAFRMRRAAAASPPNPPPTICALIGPLPSLRGGDAVRRRGFAPVHLQKLRRRRKALERRRERGMRLGATTGRAISLSMLGEIVKEPGKLRSVVAHLRPFKHAPATSAVHLNADIRLHRNIRRGGPHGHVKPCTQSRLAEIDQIGAAQRKSACPGRTRRRTFPAPGCSPCGLPAPAVGLSNRSQNRCPLLQDTFQCSTRYRRHRSGTPLSW